MLQVVSVAPVVEKKRYDGTVARIAEAVLADETGCVTFTARNGTCFSVSKAQAAAVVVMNVVATCIDWCPADQIDVLEEGLVLVLRNTNADIFNGFMRLNVTQWGKLSVHPDTVASTPAPPPSINTKNNVSAVEYELVTVNDADA